MTEPVKVTVGNEADLKCPKCQAAMFGVSKMTFGQDKKFKHFWECPDCGHKTEPK